MASLILPRAAYSQPGYGIAPFSGSPLSEGLVGVFNPAAGYALNGFPVDAEASPTRAALVGGSSGTYAKFTDSNTRIRFANAALPAILGELSVAVLFRPDAFVGYGALVSHQSSSTVGGFEFRMNATGGGSDLLIHRANTGGFTQYKCLSNITDTTGINVPVVVSCQSSINTQPRFFALGSERSAGSVIISGSGAMSAPSGPVCIGPRADNVTYFNGAIALVCVWNRQLSSDEAMAWMSNPWQLFRATPRRLYFDVGAAGGGAAALEGAANAIATATAALTTAIPLQGASVSIATATGSILSSINLAGAASSISIAAADLTTGATLSGDADSDASATGALTTHVTLSGSALAQAAATAALDSGAAQLAGTASGEASASGALSTGIDLAGDANALAAAIGSLTAEIRLSGAAVAHAFASAGLTTSPAGLAGDAAGTASASAELNTEIPLAGDATATATGAGGLTVPILLSGAAAAVSSATGDLSLAISLEGHSLAQALASGSLTAEILLSGAAVAQAVASGALSGSVRQLSPRRIHHLPYKPRVLRIRA